AHHQRSGTGRGTGMRQRIVLGVERLTGGVWTDAKRVWPQRRAASRGRKLQIVAVVSGSKPCSEVARAVAGGGTGSTGQRHLCRWRALLPGACACEGCCPRTRKRITCAELHEGSGNSGNRAQAADLAGRIRRIRSGIEANRLRVDQIWIKSKKCGSENNFRYRAHRYAHSSAPILVFLATYSRIQHAQSGKVGSRDEALFS